MPVYPSNTSEVRQAIDNFIRDDIFLLKNNVSERSITHKLAEHLRLLLPEWDVDCKYNRKLDGSKTVDLRGLIEEMARASTESSCDMINYNTNARDVNWLHDENGNNDRYVVLLGDDDSKYVKHIYPDIIVHRRGSMQNKVVIEVKIEGRQHDTEKNRVFDLAKLAALTDPCGEYSYDAGFFITLPNTASINAVALEPTKNSYLNSIIGKNRHEVYDIKVR